MQVPGNMTTPPMKLADGEEILAKAQGLRKKGLFGNRYGELYVTSNRVAFVKAIMKSGLISAALSMKGASPMLAFDRTSVKVESEPWKKMRMLVVSDGQKSERFVIESAAIDVLLKKLGQA